MLLTLQHYANIPLGEKRPEIPHVVPPVNGFDDVRDNMHGDRANISQWEGLLHIYKCEDSRQLQSFKAIEAVLNSCTVA